jgi:hypothetical protein
MSQTAEVGFNSVHTVKAPKMSRESGSFRESSEVLKCIAAWTLHHDTARRLRERLREPVRLDG